MSRHCSGLGSRVLGYHRVERGDGGRPRGYERESRPGGDRGRKRGAGRGAAGRGVRRPGGARRVQPRRRHLRERRLRAEENKLVRRRARRRARRCAGLRLPARGRRARLGYAEGETRRVRAAPQRDLRREPREAQGGAAARCGPLRRCAPRRRGRAGAHGRSHRDRHRRASAPAGDSGSRARDHLDGFFELASRPERVAVVGSSYIAIELSGIFSGLGADTALVLRGDTALKTFDDMLGEEALGMLRDAGVEVVLHASPAALTRSGRGELELKSRDGRRLGPFDCVLWAIGRAASVEELSLEKAGVALDVSGFVATDKYQACSAPGIYAIGDVTGRAQLTPAAIAAGRRLSERLFGGQSGRHLDYENIPTVVFGHPPIGTVGLSEKAARERYGHASVTVFRSSFVPLYHSLTAAKPRTHMKLVTAG